MDVCSCRVRKDVNGAVQGPKESQAVTKAHQQLKKPQSKQRKRRKNGLALQGSSSFRNRSSPASFIITLLPAGPLLGHMLYFNLE